MTSVHHIRVTHPGRIMEKLWSALVISAIASWSGPALSAATPSPGIAASHGEIGLTQQAHAESSLVDFGADAQAPQPPDVGVAITLPAEPKVPTFSPGQPIILHGSYRADLPLIRLFHEDLAASLLVTLIRTDTPWGETTRLVHSSALVTRPSPPESMNSSAYSSYREGGQFKFDLVKFFKL